MTLTKAELAAILHEKIGLSKLEAKAMVDRFFEEIRSALEAGEAVQLSNFGHFRLRNKLARPGRNPKTRESVPITARRVVTFHASNKLTAALEQAREKRQRTTSKDSERSIPGEMPEEQLAEKV